MPPGTRAKPSEERTEDMLESLKAFAEVRLETIAESHQMRVEADKQRKRATRQHYDANRVLIQAIKAAHKRGVPKGAICEHIGMTPQRLLQIERAVEAFDKKNRDAAKGAEGGAERGELDAAA